MTFSLYISLRGWSTDFFVVLFFSTNKRLLTPVCLETSRGPIPPTAWSWSAFEYRRSSPRQPPSTRLRLRELRALSGGTLWSPVTCSPDSRFRSAGGCIGSSRDMYSHSRNYTTIFCVPCAPELRG